ncbi:MAG TPA: NAD(P)-dependent oxidoreductase [Verrucomicrobiae bacterium]|nr:NAD(P)-dependent oxidoreductase [Verrucomicrobiae bacterium]
MTNDTYIISRSDRILITGSNGFIGAKVVEILLEYGFSNIRCFVRPSSDLARLQSALRRFPESKGVEFVCGDLLLREDCKAAARGASVIIHLAAGFEKSFSSVYMNSAVATENLLDAFLDNGSPRRFVQVSSFAVYSNLKMNRGALLDENGPLEDAPLERHDAYGFGKLKQEEMVREYGQSRSLPYVIVRPGAVFGPGKTDLTGRVGIRIKNFFICVGGSNQVPLTYVDNCAEAVVLAALKEGVEGEIFNVVDDDLPNSRQFLGEYCKRRRFFAVSVPYITAYWLCALCECGSRGFKQLRRFNRRRCAADWKGNRFSNERLRQHLGWKPRVPMSQAMEKFLAQFETEKGRIKENAIQGPVAGRSERRAKLVDCSAK